MYVVPLLLDPDVRATRGERDEVRARRVAKRVPITRNWYTLFHRHTSNHALNGITAIRCTAFSTFGQTLGFAACVS